MIFLNCNKPLYNLYIKPLEKSSLNKQMRKSWQFCKLQIPQNKNMILRIEMIKVLLRLSH